MSVVSLNECIFKILSKYLDLCTRNNAALSLYLILLEFFTCRQCLLSISIYLPLPPSSQIHDSCFLPNSILSHCLSTDCIKIILAICAWVKSHLLDHGQPTRDHSSEESQLLFSWQTSTVNYPSDSLGDPIFLCLC